MMTISSAWFILVRQLGILVKSSQEFAYADRTLIIKVLPVTLVTNKFRKTVLISRRNCFINQPYTCYASGPDTGPGGGGVLRFGLDESLPLKPRNPYPCLKVILRQEKQPTLNGFFSKYRPFHIFCVRIRAAHPRMS